MSLENHEATQLLTEAADGAAERGNMICTECENCIEDYNGKPYCFMGQFSLDGILMQRDSPCVDFEPKEERA